MKQIPAKEVILIIIFGILLIYFSLFQYEQGRPLSDHLPPTTQILFTGTPRELFKSPLIHTLNQAFNSDIEKTQRFNCSRSATTNHWKRAMLGYSNSFWKRYSMDQKPTQSVQKLLMGAAR